MSDGHRRAQTVIQNILRLTNLLMAGKRVAVLGHEPELAARLRAMGAQTLVTDPAGALHGHRVLPVEKALPIADLVVGAST
jgi:S-adenosylhomocysteine hydrolase